MSRTWRLTLVAAATVLLAASCGDDGEDAVDEAPAPVVDGPPEPAPDPEPAPEPEPAPDPEPAPEAEPEPVGSFDAEAAAAEVEADVALFFDNLGLMGTASGDEQQGYIDEMKAVLEGSDSASGEIFKMLGTLAAGLTTETRDGADEFDAEAAAAEARDRAAGSTEQDAQCDTGALDDMVETIMNQMDVEFGILTDEINAYYDGLLLVLDGDQRHIAVVENARRQALASTSATMVTGQSLLILKAEKLKREERALSPACRSDG